MTEHRVSYKENIYMTTTPQKCCHHVTAVEPHSLITDFCISGTATRNVVV